MTVSSGTLRPVTLRTARDIRRFAARQRRADRSLFPARPHHAHEGRGIAERLPDSPQASAALNASAEPSDEQVRLGRLSAAAIHMATATLPVRG